MASGLTRTEQYALIGVIGLIMLGVAFQQMRGSSRGEVAVTAGAGNGHWEKLGEVTGDGKTNFDPAGLQPASTPDNKIDINTAGEVELDRLPNIGPAKAKAILETRTRLGGFKSIEQLNEVKGIGPATVEKLRPRIKISPTSESLLQPAGLIE